MNTDFFIDRKSLPDEIVNKAASVRPSRRQLLWNECKFKIFIHFGMNTAQNREWGTGKEKLDEFDIPSADCRQWVRCVKNSGAGGIILTCKHHDGMCLWDTSTTEYKITNTKFCGENPVLQVSELCRQYGLKFGIYLSPWDRNHPAYGTEAYNDVYKKQLTELLTGYGKIDEVWFDGACGEGKNGKKQRYDWAGFFNTVRRYMPDAVISISATDVRWCGNEEGAGRKSEWSVQYLELPAGYDFECFVSEGLKLAKDEYLAREDLGSITQIAESCQKSEGLLKWFPAQIDVSIRPGWFYHGDEDDKVRSLRNLKDIYFGSVGNNAQLLLNIPPDRNGKICSVDERRMYQFGAYLRAMYSVDFLRDAEIKTISEHEMEFKTAEKRKFNVICLQEDISLGQQIAAFRILVDIGGKMTEVYRGTTIGGCKLAEIGECCTDTVRVEILETRGNRYSLRVFAYDAPLLPQGIRITRDDDGKVRLSGEEDIYYSIDGGAEQKYAEPFDLKYGGRITAFYRDTEKYFPLCGDLRVTEKVYADKDLFSLDPALEVDGRPTLFSGYPCEITIKLNEDLLVKGISVRSDRLGHEAMVQCCMPTKCDVFVSEDGIDYQKVISDHVFENIVNNPIAQYIPLEQRKRYLKLRITEGASENICAISDIDLEVQKPD